MTYLAAKVSNEPVVGFTLNNKKAFSAPELHNLKSSNARQPISPLSPLLTNMSFQYSEILLYFYKGI